MGPYLGAGLSLILGAEVVGWASGLGSIELPVIGALAPWQLTFMLVALPGLLMVFLLPLLHEPPRTQRLTETTDPLSWGDVARYVWPRRGIWRLFIRCAVYRAGALRVAGLGAELADSRARAGDCRRRPLLRHHCPRCGFRGGAEWAVAARWLATRMDPARAPRHIDRVYVSPYSVLVGAGLAESLSWALVLITGASYLVTFPLALFATGLQSASPNEMRGDGRMLCAQAKSHWSCSGADQRRTGDDYIFESTQAVGIRWHWWERRYCRWRFCFCGEACQPLAQTLKAEIHESMRAAAQIVRRDKACNVRSAAHTARHPVRDALRNSTLNFLVSRCLTRYPT